MSFWGRVISPYGNDCSFIVRCLFVRLALPVCLQSLCGSLKVQCGTALLLFRDALLSFWLKVDGRIVELLCFRGSVPLFLRMQMTLVTRIIFLFFCMSLYGSRHSVSSASEEFALLFN